MALLTVKELSEFTKIKKSTLYAWANKGAIPCIKLNGLLRFDLEEIKEWIRNSKVMPSTSKTPKPKSIRNKEIEGIIKRTIESTKEQGYNHIIREARLNQARKGGL